MAWWLTTVGMVSNFNMFKLSLTNYPYSKIFRELLPEEYLKFSRVVGWNFFAEWLTTKSCLLPCGEFPPYYFELNLLNIMIMKIIFILWSCIQNTVGIRVGFFESIGWLLMANDLIFARGFGCPAIFWIWLWFGT